MDTQGCKIDTGSKVLKKRQKLKKQKKDDELRVQQLHASRKTTTRQKKPTQESKHKRMQEPYVVSYMAKTFSISRRGLGSLYFRHRYRQPLTGIIRMKIRSTMRIIAMPDPNTNAAMTSGNIAVAGIRLL